MTVEFESIEVRDDESAGTLIFTLVTNKPADNTFTVQVSTRELDEPIGSGSGVADLEFATGQYLSIYTCMTFYLSLK